MIIPCPGCKDLTTKDSDENMFLWGVRIFMGRQYALVVDHLSFLVTGNNGVRTPGPKKKAENDFSQTVGPRGEKKVCAIITVVGEPRVWRERGKRECGTRKTKQLPHSEA